MQANKQLTKAGQKLTIAYEDREFEVIVIDPHGLGFNQPSIGFGLMMAERYIGIDQTTLSRWSTTEQGFDTYANLRQKLLELPSGKRYELMQILGTDNRNYTVIEAGDWVDLVGDVLETSGKLRKVTKKKLIDFLKWFAVKGFYAESYTALKGTYTKADSEAVSVWLQARLNGKTIRNRYTNFLHQTGVESSYEYARWTNHIYEGLFGLTKKQMLSQWELVDGEAHIGRNYVSQPEALKAIAFCEEMAEKVYLEDIKDAHDLAIALTKKKFKGVISG
jgi:hypothetical protein